MCASLPSPAECHRPGGTHPPPSAAHPPERLVTAQCSRGGGEQVQEVTGAGAGAAEGPAQALLGGGGRLPVSERRDVSRSRRGAGTARPGLTSSHRRPLACPGEPLRQTASSRPGGLGQGSWPACLAVRSPLRSLSGPGDKVCAPACRPGGRREWLGVRKGCSASHPRSRPIFPPSPASSRWGRNCVPEKGKSLSSPRDLRM